MRQRPQHCAKLRPKSGYRADMTTTQIIRPTSSTYALIARRDLGGRLRSIRKQADLTGKGLTGRGLAELMGCHPTKISRIENGSAAPSVADIRAWCVHCNAEDQIDDLVAEAVAAEAAYSTWRTEQRAGLVRLQTTMDTLYARTERLRCYETRVVPSLLQTEDYAATILGRLQARRGTPDDVREAAAARAAHRHLLHGTGSYAFILEESVLRSRVAQADVMRAQLDQLVEDSRLPRVSLGIIPLDTQRDQWPTESFFAHDEELVRVQLVSGRWTATAPGDVAEYLAVFEELAAIAVVGDDARDLIRRASTE